MFGRMSFGTRGDLLDGVRYRPVTPGGELAHGVYLRREGMLIVSRNTGREGSAHG